MTGAAPRRIVLCADDYGISDGVNRAIRDLLVRRRINATSVMMVGPAIGRDDVAALKDAAQTNADAQIGLHATLTAPFHPLTIRFRPTEGEAFWPLARMLRASMLRRLDRDMMQAEFTAQLAAFTNAFDRAPDYVDGHQHVQLFPGVRDAFLGAVKDRAPQAWVRQCGRVTPLRDRLAAPKALLLDAMSGGFRRVCERTGVTFNPAFAGAYDFTQVSDFGARMAGFLERLPDGGLVMCHPGIVDDTLRALDPFTDQREREYAWLGGDDFQTLLDAHRVTLGRFKHERSAPIPIPAKMS